MAQLIYSPRIQAIDADGNPLVGALLYTYDAGTVTPRVTYSDAALSTPNTNPIVSDSSGRFSAIYVATSGQNLKLTMRTSTGSLVLEQDNVPLIQFLAGELGTILHPRAPAEISAGVTPTSYQYPEGHVFRYMTAAQITDVVSNTGAADVRGPLQTSIDVAVRGGAQPVWPTGTYLVRSTASPGSDPHDDGVVVPYTTQNSTTGNVAITAGRSTILKAGDDDMIVLRWAASNGSLLPGLTIDANSQTGCIAFAMVPEDRTQTTDLVFQMFNLIGNLWITGAFDEGVLLQAGPDVAAADSGCWYNTFLAVHALYCVRGIHLNSPTNAGGSPANRNRFLAVRCGQTGMNTGIQITSGDTNEFYGAALEGVQDGTTPNSTPTAVKVLASCPVSSADNNDNKFFGGHCEACTRDVENANSRTHFYGFGFAHTKTVYTEKPAIALSADPSVAPLIVPGMSYGEGLSGFPSTVWGMLKQLYDYDGTTLYDRADVTLTTSNTANVAAIAASGEDYWWDKLNDIVELTVRLQFQATSGAAEIGIPLPVDCHASYLGPASENPWFTATVSDGSTLEQVPVFFKSGDAENVYVEATSGGWDAAATNNRVHLSIRYRAAAA